MNNNNNFSYPNPYNLQQDYMNQMSGYNMTPNIYPNPNTYSNTVSQIPDTVNPIDSQGYNNFYTQ